MGSILRAIRHHADAGHLLWLDMQTLLAVFDGLLAHGSTAVVVEHDHGLLAHGSTVVVVEHDHGLLAHGSTVVVVEHDRGPHRPTPTTSSTSGQAAPCLPCAPDQ